MILLTMIPNKKEINGEEMDGIEEANSNVDHMKESILDCVAQSNGFFKSQQVGEKDLTFLEKRDIASELLKGNVSLFLQRYWKYVKIEDIEYFGMPADYELNFYLSEIRKYHSGRSKQLLIRNRRYEALKKMKAEGSYFSDCEMKKRNPFLYHQLIGQYLTENERIAEYNKQHQNDRFSHFLMGQIERNIENCLFEQQENDEDAKSREDEDKSDSEESELEDDEPQMLNVSKQEQFLLRNEFTNIMYENFLNGKDEDFDYSTVDDNVEYDSVEQRNIDIEEKYFDED